MFQYTTEFGELLTKAIHQIKEHTKQSIYEIEDELGMAIYRSRETIEKWRRGNMPADLEQVKIVAGILLKKKGLADRAEFELLLSHAGHPRPAAAWQELFSPPPLDIPMPDDYFIERKDKLDELLSALHDPELKIISLCGPGGIGKTALLTAALHKLTPDREPPRIFSDGILYYNFYARFSIDDAFRYIAQFFGVTVSKETAPRDAARLALRNRHALLALDGAEEAENLKSLLDIRDTVKVLIVTRYEHVARGRRVIHLDAPQSDLAIQIFSAWCTGELDGLNSPEWDDDVDIDLVTVKEICELVGFLPLALRLAGRYVSQCQVNLLEYLALLKETALAVLHEDDRQHASVAVLLDKTLEKVRRDAHDVLAVIGVLAYNSFDLEVVVSALASNTTVVALAIGDLVRFGMLKRLSDGRYQVIHRLIHTYATERMTVPEEALKRIATYYTTLTNEQTDLGDQGQARLNVERPHLMDIIEKCLQRGEWRHVWDLTYAMQRYLYFQYRLTDLMTVNQAGLQAAGEARDRRKQAEWLTILGDMHRILRQRSDAFFRYLDALEIYEELGDLANLARCLTNVGIACHHFGSFAQTVAYYERALKIAREINARDTEGIILINWANAEAKDGNLDSAIDLYQQALPLLHELGEQDAEADCVGNLGIAFSELGKPEQAHRYFQQALALYRGLGDRYNEGLWLRRLAAFYIEQQDVEGAIECFQAVLAISREIGDRNGEGEALESLGELYREREQYPEAIAYSEAALKVASEVEAHEHMAGLQREIGKTYFLDGNLTQAIEYYKLGLDLYTKLDDFDEEIGTLRLLGEAYLQLGQMEQALAYYHQALDKLRAIGDVDNEAIYLNQLGKVYEGLAQTEQAIAYYQQAVLLTFEAGEFDLGDDYLQHFASRCSKYNCSERMILVLEQIVEWYPKTLIYYHYLGDYYLVLEEVDKAEAWYYKEVELQPKNSLAAHVALGVICSYRGEALKSNAYFETALTIWELQTRGRAKLDIRLLGYRFWILLGLGREAEVLSLLREALKEYHPWELVWFPRYQLLVNSPTPPPGLPEVTRLLKEAEAKVKQ